KPPGTTIRSAGGSSVSRCQTMSGGVPVARSSATRASRSRFEPGKTMTAVFIGRAICFRSRRDGSSSVDVDRVVLDDGIGEELGAHRFDLLARLGGVAFLQLDLDQLALSDPVHPGESERGEGMPDRLALRIQDATLQRD